jgi:hypothetical protein
VKSGRLAIPFDAPMPSRYAYYFVTPKPRASADRPLPRWVLGKPSPPGSLPLASDGAGSDHGGGEAPAVSCTIVPPVELRARTSAALGKLGFPPLSVRGERHQLHAARTACSCTAVASPSQYTVASCPPLPNRPAPAR